jgi:hypothetical protein
MDGEMHTPLAFCCPPVVSPVMKVAMVKGREKDTLSS